VILRLTGEQLRLLRNESRKTHPVEACGLLFGRLIDGETVVTRVVIMPNVLKSPVRFEADPQTVFNAFEQAERDELQFIGLFHSHPAPASPSAVDLKYMRLWGEAVWLILSSIDGTIAAFKMTDGDSHEVSLKVEAV
jgi:proteasome lid subunit RPN8/RPN11